MSFDQLFIEQLVVKIRLYFVFDSFLRSIFLEQVF